MHLNAMKLEKSTLTGNPLYSVEISMDRRVGGVQRIALHEKPLGPRAIMQIMPTDETSAFSAVS